MEDILILETPKPKAPETRPLRKARQFHFVIDGVERVLEASYANQAENELLTETWAKAQAARLFPDAQDVSLPQVKDITYPVTD